MVVVDAHCGSQCIDLMLVDNLQNPTKVLIFEIKGTRATNSPSWKFGTRIDPETGLLHQQLSRRWLELVESEGSLGADAKELLRRIREEGLGYEKYGFFVDGNGVSKILKLD